jgi:hypothetical protein
MSLFQNFITLKVNWGRIPKGSKKLIGFPNYLLNYSMQSPYF